MLKACSRCGKIHSTTYRCKDNRIKIATDENRMRSTYKWTKKSLQVRDESHYLCQVCLDQGIITYEGVEVHHIDALKDRPDLLLDDDNLVCLCVEHHKQAETGQLSKDYLRELATHRGDRGKAPHGEGGQFF